ncbi:alpha/beta fold hydrolase [Rhodococcus pyridinivorans]
MTDVHVVLIHGAWAGPWVWDGLLGPIAAAGFRPHPVSLPGVGSNIRAGEPVDLAGVTAAVIEQTADLDGPLVVVGHSGGGVVATQVAEQLADRVAGVAFIAGMMLPSGYSFGDICADVGLDHTTGINRYLEISDSKRISSVPADAAAAIFFHRAPADAAIAAARRLQPQEESTRLITPTWTTTRFGALPRLYIEALDDRSVPLPTQRRMQQLTPGAQVHTLDTDHAPQLSMPEATTHAMCDFIASLDLTAPFPPALSR